MIKGVMVERVRVQKVDDKPKRKVGRPKGSTEIPRSDGRHLTARQIRAWAFRTGELPHVILLRIARGEEKVLGRKPTSEEIIDCAKASAPYFVPKLASMTVTGDEGGPIQTQNLVLNADALSRLSDAELEVFRYLFGRLTGQSTGTGDGRAITGRATEEEAPKPYSRTIDVEPQ